MGFGCRVTRAICWGKYVSSAVVSVECVVVGDSMLEVASAAPDSVVGKEVVTLLKLPGGLSVLIGPFGTRVVVDVGLSASSEVIMLEVTAPSSGFVVAIAVVVLPGRVVGLEESSVCPVVGFVEAGVSSVESASDVVNNEVSATAVVDPPLEAPPESEVVSAGSSTSPGIVVGVTVGASGCGAVTTGFAGPGPRFGGPGCGVVTTGLPGPGPRLGGAWTVVGDVVFLPDESDGSCEEIGGCATNDVETEESGRLDSVEGGIGFPIIVSVVQQMSPV